MGNFLKKFREARRLVQTIRKSVQSIPDDISDTVGDDAWQEQFQLVYGVTKPVLMLTKQVTPDKVDSVIDEIITVGDEIATKGADANNYSVFIEKFAEVWWLAKGSCYVAMAFTDSKVDEKILKFVAWGDLISQQVAEKDV